MDMSLDFYAYSGLISGFMLSMIDGKLLKLIKIYLVKILHSPLVQQVLNVTMGLTTRQASDIIINLSKEIAVILLNTLILIANLLKEVLVLFKNIFIVVKATVNMLYIILSTVNTGIQKIFDISYLFSSFVTRPTIVYSFWGTILCIFATGYMIEKLKLRAQQSYKTSDHSGREVQAEQPGNCQSLPSTQQGSQGGQSEE